MKILGFPPRFTGSLTTGLADLATAQQAKTDALVDALENEQVAAETSANAETATDLNVGEALTLATTGVDAELDKATGTNVNFAAAGDNTKAGLIADGRTAAQKTIADQQKVVATAEAAATAGVVAALDTVAARLASYEAAIDTAAAAVIAENGEEAKFETVNDVAIVVTPASTGNVATLTVEGHQVATDVNGKWTVADADNALEGLSGFDTYLASLQAETDAANAEIDAKASLKSAIAQVVALENEDSSITADDVSDDVIGANSAAAGESANVTLDMTKEAPVGANAPAVTATTDGTADIGTAEVNTVTFVGLAAAGVITVGGLTLTASGDLTASAVAAAFADSTNFSGTGTFTGTLSTDWTVSDTSGDDVVFESQLDGDVTEISITSNVTVDETTPGVASIPGTNEVQTVTFESLVTGQTVTVDGATLTAVADLTADQVAGAFANLGAVNTETVGTVAGTLTSFTAGTANGDELAFTATTVGDKGSISLSASSNGVVTETATDAQSLLDERVELAADEQALVELNTAISEWEALVALDGQLEDLDTAVTAAESAITDSEEDGGLGVTLLDGVDNFTAESDVYMFAEGTDQQLSGFGANGEDNIYFGEGFSLVQIADGKTITDNVGDVATQEILWLQDGNNLVLYVEEASFAGNSSAGDANDITTITLTGVSSADVTLEGGFLTAGTAA